MLAPPVTDPMPAGAPAPRIRWWQRLRSALLLLILLAVLGVAAAVLVILVGAALITFLHNAVG